MTPHLYAFITNPILIVVGMAILVPILGLILFLIFRAMGGPPKMGE